LLDLGFSGADQGLGYGSRLGNYRIVRKLGSGGMGTVYEAKHVGSGRVLAIKLLKTQIATEKNRVRFLQEGRLAASISHPNAVYIYGTEEIEGIPVITMELVSEGNLEAMVKRGGRRPATKATKVILQLMDGLEAVAREGILHRDIKPSNCFMGQDGTPKIGDFGLALSTTSTGPSLTEEGNVWCTPGFASPEQVQGKALDVRSEIFSLGATLYFLLTGEVPFKERKGVRQICEEIAAGPPRAFLLKSPDIPVDLARIVLRCIDPSREQRFGSYAQLRQELAVFAGTDGHAKTHETSVSTGLAHRETVARGPAISDNLKAGKAPRVSKIGQFTLQTTLLRHPSGDLILAYDEQLRRSVWIVRTPIGTPPTLPTRCELARSGRLRWLAGKRTSKNSWDAYEAPRGRPLLDILETPQPSFLVRDWLVEISKELASSIKCRDLPLLTPHRLWITSDNRVKLIEFPICEEDFVAVEIGKGVTPDFTKLRTFLREFVVLCLVGKGPDTAKLTRSEMGSSLSEAATVFCRAISKINSSKDLLAFEEELFSAEL